MATRAFGNVATLRSFTNVREFGAVGNGVADDTTAISNAITNAGTYGTVALPYGNYKITGTLTLLTGQTLLGIGGRPTITRAFAGTMINAAAVGTRMEFLDIRGAGATYTNTSTDIAVLYNNGSNYYQEMHNVWIIDNAGPCISFSVSDAGSQSKFVGCLLQRTTTTNPAIVLPTTVDTVGYREFYDCRGGGSWLMRFNSGINTKIIGGDSVNLDFSGSEGVSLRTVVQGHRIATGAANFTLYGNDSVISGCVIAGPGVITGAASRNQILGNVLQAGQTWTDNSTSTGDNVNHIDAAYYTPTITWGADTTNPTLGNGTLNSRVFRRGRNLKVDIILGIGSTTTLGTGSWYFQLPSPFSTWNAKQDTVGIVRILDSGNTWYTATAYISSGTKKIYMLFGNNVGPATPMTWANGDALYLTIDYEIS